MDKKTKQIMIFGALAIGAYLLYKKYGTPAPAPASIPAPGSNAALNMLAPIIPTIGPVTPTPVMTDIVKTNANGQPLTYYPYVTV